MIHIIIYLTRKYYIFLTERIFTSNFITYHHIKESILKNDTILNLINYYSIRDLFKQLQL